MAAAPPPVLLPCGFGFFWLQQCGTARGPPCLYFSHSLSMPEGPCTPADFGIIRMPCAHRTTGCADQNQRCSMFGLCFRHTCYAHTVLRVHALLLLRLHGPLSCIVTYRLLCCPAPPSMRVLCTFLVVCTTPLRAPCVPRRVAAGGSVCCVLDRGGSAMYKLHAPHMCVHMQRRMETGRCNSTCNSTRKRVPARTCTCRRG